MLQQPTYSSKHPPGQGLAMAIGQVVLGDPWWGVWLSAGALVAALCWALQGWLSPGWALFGGVLAIPMCLFGYWMNSYWGGAVAGFGGALVLGSYARIVRGRRPVWGWSLGIGLVVLHHALVSYQHWPEYERIIGGRYPESDGKSGVVTPAVFSIVLAFSGSKV